MDYKILSSQNTSTLVSEVKDAIAQGWRPQGGVGAAEKNGMIYKYQAMVNG